MWSKPAPSPPIWVFSCAQNWLKWNFDETKRKWLFRNPSIEKAIVGLPWLKRRKLVIHFWGYLQTLSKYIPLNIKKRHNCCSTIFPSYLTMRYNLPQVEEVSQAAISCYSSRKVVLKKKIETTCFCDGPFRDGCIPELSGQMERKGNVSKITSLLLKLYQKMIKVSW